MSAERSCWNCSRRIGGEHCPAERKKEAKLRAKVLEAQRGVRHDEEAVEKLTGGRLKLVITGEDGRGAHFVALSEEEARERVEADGGRKDPHGPYKGDACEEWEPQEPYTLEEMKEIADRVGVRTARSPEQVKRYRRIRERRRE